MFLHIVFPFAVLLDTTNGLLKNTIDKTGREGHANYQQLIEFIDLLNSQNEDRLKELNDPKFMRDIAAEGQINQYKSTVNKKVNENIQNILRMVQKNYDANERYDAQKPNAESGLMFISNPEVLEEYKTGFNNQNVQYSNGLRRKTQRSSSFSEASSTSSDESDDRRRNLKNILQDIRKTVNIPISNKSKELQQIRRRNRKAYPNRGSNKEDSIEKPAFKEDAPKQKKKKIDLSYALDTNQHVPKNKKDYGPRKRPVVYQPSSKMKDSYKPKKESYLQRREDYRSYGRTSIPVVGKKAVYDRK